MSSEPAVLGLDLGTTECKGVLFSARGRLLGESHVPCDLLRSGQGWVEQDPRLWWSAAKEAVTAVVKGASLAAGAICGIGVSSQGISFVPTDERGEPLGNAICWLDTRAKEQAQAVLRRVPASELFARTGKRASPAYVLPKLLWLQQERPEVFAQAAKFLMAHDHVVHRLTGQQVTDHTLASGTMLYNVCQQSWDAWLLDMFAVPGDKLPALAWSGSCAGELRPDAAEQLSLPSGVPVAVGGQDQKLAALGAGIGPMRATISLGTAAALSLVVGKPTPDRGMRIPLFSFCLPGLWDLEGVIGTAGASLAWFREALAPGASFACLDEEARGSAAGANGVRFYPHLAGATSPHWQEDTRGAFLGLSLATSRADLVRAVLEGVAYQARLNLSIMAEVARQPEDVVVFGGGARSRLWRQILADVLGKPIGVTETVEAASLGAGILAAVAGGIYSSVEEGQGAMLGQLEWQEPDWRAASVYQETYTEYLHVEGALLGGR